MADAGQAAAPREWPEADHTFTLIRRMALWLAIGIATLAILLAAAPFLPASAPVAAEIGHAGLGGTVLGSMLIGLAGLLGCLIMAWARRIGRPSLIGRAARRPQAIVVPLTALIAGLVVWRLEPTPVLAMPGLAGPVGGAMLLLAFPLLVLERVAASLPERRLPEARALQALLFVPVAAIAAAGVLEIAAGGGALWPRELAALLAFVVVLIAAELGVRALANWFLPPAEPDHARAAIASLLARLLRPRLSTAGGVSGQIRTHLGIDFARSWALRYLQAAAPPVLVLLALLAWGLSGVSLVGMDQRAVYERFGAPQRVLQPGLHAGLPWPLGRVRRLELGVVHAVPLSGGVEASDIRVGAEDVPPPTLDRLWETEHPAETSYLIASNTSVTAGDSAGRQSFQTVSVDLRVLWRIGLDDRSALLAAYAQSDPDALVRAQAGRLVSALFAGQTLDALLVGDRAQLAEGLRRDLQAALDRLDAGVEVVGISIEAIHPPAGAAAAYHDVQAAAITASGAISIERGRAIADRNRALTLLAESTAKAKAQAAETIGAARVALRQFTADQDAAASGGYAFLLERYLGNLTAALPKAPLVIIDHRLGGADGPTIDLRTFGPAGPAADTE